MVEESESALANQQKSRELETANLKLEAEKKILVSRCNNLEVQLKSASSSESDSEKSKKEIEALKQRMNDMEEDHSENVKVLEDERDDARRKEEEYFLELQTRLQDLEDTQAGYVDLSDRLNDKVDQIYDLEEKASSYKDENERLLSRALKAEAELTNLKIELSSHQSNAGSSSSGGNKEEKEENGGSDAQRNDNVNKEEMLALHEELKAARAETIKFEQRAVTAENEIEKFRKLEEELADVKKQESQLRGQYDEQAEKLKQAEDAAVKHMDTLAEHMKKSDDAIQSLEEQLCKAKADVDKWKIVLLMLKQNLWKSRSVS